MSEVLWGLLGLALCGLVFWAVVVRLRAMAARWDALDRRRDVVAARRAARDAMKGDRR